MFTAFDLTGKVALVTGGSRGIGLGMAKALAQAGADVAIWGRNADSNAAALAEIEAQGSGRCLAQSVDVGDEGAVTAAMGELLGRFGRLDAAFANAGIMGSARPFAALDAAALGEILQANVIGTMLTLREAAKHMIARAKAGDPGGSLVGFSTVGTEKGLAYFHPYAASKGAIETMIRSMAMELGRYAIRANAIQPGFVQTGMTQSMRDNESVDADILARIPAKRWGRPEDFGGIAVYLASDASAYQSGSTVCIDGGYLRV